MVNEKTTLAKVAHAAGVSLSTASLAFSGNGPISQHTKAKVLGIAKDLGYRGPDPLGRQLRSGKTGIVGVVLGNHLEGSFQNPVSIQIIDGLSTALGAAGIGVLLIPGPANDTPHVVAPLIMNAGMDLAVMIWGTTEDDPSFQALRQRNLPVVVGEGDDIAGASLVAIDDRNGTRQLAEHLQSLGHKRFALIALPFFPGSRGGKFDFAGLSAESIAWTPPRARIQGLQDAAVVPQIALESANSGFQEGKELTHQILDAYPDATSRPTAIVAQSDLMAAGAVLAVKERGLRVPQDISVVGFDGIELPILAPEKLTTVRQPLAEKGALIGEVVLDVLAGNPVRKEIVKLEFIAGSTTGPAKLT